MKNSGTPPRTRKDAYGIRNAPDRKKITNITET